MFKLLKIKIDEVTHSSISISWLENDTINANGYCINVKKHSKRIEDLGMIQATESACGYTLVNLDPSTIYEIRIAPIVNDKRFSWSLPECVMTLAQPDRDILVNSERQVQNSAHDLREVLMARRTKNWRDFTKNSYKFCVPKELSELRMKRVLIWGEAMTVWEDNEYDPNDNHFMGPIYRN